MMLKFLNQCLVREFCRLHVCVQKSNKKQGKRKEHKRTDELRGRTAKRLRRATQFTLGQMCIRALRPDPSTLDACAVCLRATYAAGAGIKHRLTGPGALPRLWVIWEHAPSQGELRAGGTAPGR